MPRTKPAGFCQQICDRHAAHRTHHNCRGRFARELEFQACRPLGEDSPLQVRVTRRRTSARADRSAFPIAPASDQGPFTARAVSLFSDLWACPARRIPVQRVGGRVDRAVFLFSEPGDAFSAAREMFSAPWACFSNCISAYFVRRCVEQVRDSPVAPVQMFSAPYSLCRGGGRLATAIWFLSALWARFQRAGAFCALVPAFLHAYFIFSFRVHVDDSVPPIMGTVGHARRQRLSLWLAHPFNVAHRPAPGRGHPPDSRGQVREPPV